MAKGKDYEVGYGKPPKHTRFKKGRSGNPKGRPGGSKNFSTDVKAVLAAPVKVTENGRTRTVSTQRAALMRLREKALAGDARAIDLLTALAGRHNDEEIAQAAANLSQDDTKILENFLERLQRRREERGGHADDGRDADDAAGNGDEEPDDDTGEEDDDDWLG